jgi:hypothetical protein
MANWKTIHYGKMLMKKAEDKIMKDIVNVLKAETKTLKFQYIEMTKKWANDEYNRLGKINETDVVKERGFRNSFGRMEHTKASYTYWNTIKRSVQKGQDEFIKHSLKDAEEHYENSILKLSERISEKGLNISTLKAKTSHIGVNIETVLTDGNNKILAYTIIASGDIQKPHYRYLIK